MFDTDWKHLRELMPKRLCRRCEYYEEVEEDGYCYRYPPRLVVINKAMGTSITRKGARQEIRTEYPIVDKDLDWCGEFKRRVEEEEVIDIE